VVLFFVGGLQQLELGSDRVDDPLVGPFVQGAPHKGEVGYFQ
jgi:hypothetical protein